MKAEAKDHDDSVPRATGNCRSRDAGRPQPTNYNHSQALWKQNWVAQQPERSARACLYTVYSAGSDSVRARQPQEDNACQLLRLTSRWRQKHSNWYRVRLGKQKGQKAANKSPLNCEAGMSESVWTKHARQSSQPHSSRDSCPLKGPLIVRPSVAAYIDKRHKMLFEILLNTQQPSCVDAADTAWSKVRGSPSRPLAHSSPSTAPATPNPEQPLNPHQLFHPRS